MRYQPTLAVEERKEVMANAFRRLDRSSEIHLRLSLEFEGRIYLLSKNPGALEFEVRILQAGRPQLVCNFRDFYSRVFLTVYRGRVCVLGYWLWSFTEDNFFRVKNVCHPVVDATTNPPTIVAQYMEEIFRYADWIGDDILRSEFSAPMLEYLCSIIVDNYGRLIVLTYSRILWLWPDFGIFYERDPPEEFSSSTSVLAEIDGVICLIRRPRGKNALFIKLPVFPLDPGQRLQVRTQDADSNNIFITPARFAGLDALT